jgi:hypothetical protein
MNDEPLDDRLREQWKSEAETKAWHFLLNTLMSKEGKSYLLNARQYADKDRVHMLLMLLKERIDSLEGTDQKFVTGDMVGLATVLLTAAIASTEYGINRKSWEN